jgi:hypothetical protein
MDWWFFREGTEPEARDYLARFIEEGAAWAESLEPGADLSPASVPEVIARVTGEVELVDASPPAGAPDWVRDVVSEHGIGFRDFAESSRSCVLRAAYYFGASFVTTYPVLRWDIGREDRPEVRQPVVTGFGSGEDLPVLPVVENALLAGDPGAAVRQWRHAVAGAPAP